MPKKQAQSPKQKAQRTSKKIKKDKIEEQMLKPAVVQANFTEQEQSESQHVIDHPIRDQKRLILSNEDEYFRTIDANMNQLKQLDSPSVVSRLDQYQMQFDEDEDGIPARRAEDPHSVVYEEVDYFVLEAPVRRRVRDRLPEGEERRFSNFPKILIGALKQYRYLYKYDFLQNRSLLTNQELQKVYQQLLNVLRHLSSRSPQKYYLMMLFNKQDPILIQLIRDKVRRTRAERYYLKIVDRYPTQLINQAKAILRSIVRRELKDDIISRQANRRDFRGPNRQIKIERFQKYFKNFRSQLQNNYIRPIVRKNNVLNQTLFRN